MALNIFLLSLQLVTRFNKTNMLQGNKQKMSQLCGDMVGISQRGFPCFLFPIGWEMHPLGLHFCLGISQSFSATLEVLPKRTPNLFGHFPKSCQYPLGSAQMVSKS
jgi:hypothetical protein